jgi:hypothetical protein
LNPLNLVHGLFKKINPISVSYSENLNRSANQVLGEVPTGYKFGWLPEHGLEQSAEVGSNLGNWDHKRDGSIRTGFKISRSLTISTNFSQNFTTTRSSTGLEQLSMTRDYFAYGDLLDAGLPFPGWSFRMSGLEKWPIIKWVAKSASLEHSYSGKETRSWQFEDISPRITVFQGCSTFAEDYKENERSSRINRNFSPLIGMNMTWKGNISVTFRHNRNNPEMRPHIKKEGKKIEEGLWIVDESSGQIGQIKPEERYFPEEGKFTGKYLSSGFICPI